MPAVSIAKLRKTFGGQGGVSDVDLNVQDGEFVTLLGQSGCGKSTSLRMVAGLETAESGSIRIGETTVSDPSRGIFVPPERRNIGMVFQSYAIWPHMTVFENVAFPLTVRRLKGNEIRARVSQALQLVEMREYIDRPAPALSGGQQQRVAIARALVAEPDLLLLDEPLSNLDAKLRLQMGVEFRKLQRRLGITCMYVTHDQQEAMVLSDRIVVMQRGRILQTASPKEIYQRPASPEIANFFGTPNLWPCTVRQRSLQVSGRYRLHVAGAGWSGTCMADYDFAPGEAAMVMIRPEDLRITQADALPLEEGLSWSGRVTEASFYGARTSIVVSSSVGEVRAEVATYDAPEVGAEVQLKAGGDCAWAMKPQILGPESAEGAPQPCSTKYIAPSGRERALLT